MATETASRSDVSIDDIDPDEATKSEELCSEAGGDRRSTKSEDLRSEAKGDALASTKSDELYQMAESIRDDDLYDVPIIDWTARTTDFGNDHVTLTIVTPQMETETVLLDWPEKPTSDNTFIHTCQVALGVDSPQEAALMADELQGVEHTEFTVPADVEDGRWTLKPEAAGRTQISERFIATDDTDVNTLSRFGKWAGIIGGPMSLVLHGFQLVEGEPGCWFDDTSYASDVYWTAQATWYSTIGTILWAVCLCILLLL